MIHRVPSLHTLIDLCNSGEEHKNEPRRASARADAGRPHCSIRGFLPGFLEVDANLAADLRRPQAWTILQLALEA